MKAKALALLVVAAILLSGCASKKGDDDNGGSTGTSTKTASTSATTTATTSTTRTSTGGPGNGTGHAPTASLAANVTAGAAPLNVTFTLAAKDTDGDALAWSLDFGDGSAAANGTAPNGTLATTLAHVFAGGNHTAVLNVTAGGVSVLANVTVSVQGGSGGAPLVDETLHVIFGCEACTDAEGEAVPCIGLGAGRNEGDCAWVELTAEAAGRMFTVSGTSPSPLPDPLPHGTNPDIAVLATCAIDADVLLFQASETDADESGTIPPGAGCLVAWDYDETWMDLEFHFLVA